MTSVPPLAQSKDTSAHGVCVSERPGKRVENFTRPPNRHTTAPFVTLTVFAQASPCHTWMNERLPVPVSVILPP